MIKRGTLSTLTISFTWTYQFFSIIIYSYRNEKGWPIQSINNYPNRIELPRSIGKTNHKIHSYSFSLSFHNWHSLKQTCCPLIFILHLFAILTLRQELRYILLHTGPTINLLQVYIHLGQPEWIEYRLTMRFLQQFMNQIINSRNTNSSFETKYTFCIKIGLFWLTNHSLLPKILQMFIFKLFGLNLMNERIPQFNAS